MNSRSRGYLPHLESSHGTYFVTFRLADSLPVSVLFTVEGTSTLSSVVHGWKGATAFHANRILARAGRFWQPEYFDVLVRTTRQFEFCLRYILNNPVKACLCAKVFQWPWSGCSLNLQYYLDRFFGAD
jgi:hypothetical protein